MKRLMMSAFAAIVLLAAATTILRSHARSSHGAFGPEGIVSVQDMHRAASVSKLPIDEFKDQPLAFSSPPRLTREAPLAAGRGRVAHRPGPPEPGLVFKARGQYPAPVRASP